MEGERVNRRFWVVVFEREKIVEKIVKNAYNAGNHELND